MVDVGKLKIKKITLLILEEMEIFSESLNSI